MVWEVRFPRFYRSFVIYPNRSILFRALPLRRHESAPIPNLVAELKRKVEELREISAMLDSTPTPELRSIGDNGFSKAAYEYGKIVSPAEPASSSA